MVGGGVNRGIALYYYVNVIRLMYLATPDRSSPLRTAPVLRLALGVCGAGTVLLGVFPAPLLALLQGLSVVNRL